MDSSSRKELLDSLDAELMLDGIDVEEGEWVRSEVVLRNVGRNTLEFHSGRPLRASLLDPSSLAYVGGFVGWIAGVGILIRLGPGDTTPLPVLLGTERGGPDIRLALPPGIYLAEVRVPIHTMSADNSRYETNYLAAPPVEIRIVSKLS
jgi:hypothetical protein